ncbi:MAG: hypothetical protein OXG62_10610 [Nitrospinae bacterium]|nr:hypothetical protein [Nitrospinota bacterium]
MIEKISSKRVTPAHPLGKENIARLLSVCDSARAMLGGGNARA